MSELKTNTYTSPTTGKPWSYLTAGPVDGPLIFFLHGWPGIALTWKSQLQAFSSLGFSVVAPDMPGYGGTWTSKDSSEFALEELVPQFIELLHHAVGRKDAIWVGHDWGVGPLYGLAAHHPELCKAIVGISVPYRTLEVGLSTALKTIDRDLYPESEYPWGQWDYQVFYEQDSAAIDRQFESNLEKNIKLLYSRGNPDSVHAPARTSRVTKDKGWFGGPDAAPNLPDLPLQRTVLDQGLLDDLVTSAKKNGWHGASAWYLNHAANEKYANALDKSVNNNGVLSMPVLFIHTEYDAVCQTVHNPKLMAEMRGKCEKLSEFVIKAGHWGMLECPEEVNAGIAEWVLKNVRESWPGPAIKSRI
jgi:soluble epoxide hydrolase/lipid-phosphate phosphatase